MLPLWAGGEIESISDFLLFCKEAEAPKTAQRAHKILTTET